MGFHLLLINVARDNTSNFPLPEPNHVQLNFRQWLLLRYVALHSWDNITWNTRGIFSSRMDHAL